VGLEHSSTLQKSRYVHLRYDLRIKLQTTRSILQVVLGLSLLVLGRQRKVAFHFAPVFATFYGFSQSATITTAEGSAESPVILEQPVRFSEYNLPRSVLWDEPVGTYDLRAVR